MLPNLYTNVAKAPKPEPLFVRFDSGTGRVNICDKAGNQKAGGILVGASGNLAGNVHSGLAERAGVKLSDRGTWDAEQAVATMRQLLAQTNRS